MNFTRMLSCNLLLATAACMGADYYEVRGGIPNSQYFLKANVVGNQYLFFIGDSVLAGTGLKDQGLRYSAQMVKGLVLPGSRHPRNPAHAAGRQLVWPLPL